MNLPVASCLVCGQEKELAVWVDPAVTGGSFHGVCFQCRQAAQQRMQSDVCDARLENHEWVRRDGIEICLHCKRPRR